MELPLFPLSTVLFPGGPLALRIFEPRYLTMIGECMRGGHGFGVVLIDSGTEVGAATFASTGTIAEIVDFDQRPDGLLGIVAVGRERFRVRASTQRPDGLYVGDVETAAPEPAQPLPQELTYLRSAAEQLVGELGPEYRPDPCAPIDAAWVSYRLAEMLPLSLETRQSLLEMPDALRRIETLLPHISRPETN
jgi:Lon protease-like protein